MSCGIVAVFVVVLREREMARSVVEGEGVLAPLVRVG